MRLNKIPEEYLEVIKKVRIFAPDLEPKDGVIKKTFGPSHYSWWRSIDFNYSQAQQV